MGDDGTEAGRRTSLTADPFTERGAREMKGLGLGRNALCSCVAAAVLTGCGGSQPPIAAMGAMPQSSAAVTQAKHRGSWMLPEAKNDDLLYVSNSYTVTAYSYP